MATFRETPYASYNFTVDLGDGDTDSIHAGFSEVSGLATGIQTIEYRNGNDRVNAVRRIPGLRTTPEVHLRRGVIGVDRLCAWLDAAASGRPDAWRTVTINLLSEDRQSVAQSWRLQRALPVRYTGPTLRAQGNDVAIEELVIVCESLTVE